MMSSQRDDTPVWFITGCSSGLGRALSEHLLRTGMRVVLTARDAAAIMPLAAQYPQSSIALQMDVTNEAETRAAIDAGHSQFGRLDVLVNNAGYAYLAAAEEGHEDQIREMFEVNLFGTIRTTRLVLPIMRAQRRGHIINVGSIAGITGLPSGAYYSATKFALEGFSEALATEVDPLGIAVTIVEPGGFRTDFAGRSLRTADNAISDYDETAGKRQRQIVANHGKQPGDPQRFAEAVCYLASSKPPPKRFLLGGLAFDAAHRHLSGRLEEAEAWQEISRSADYANPIDADAVRP